MERQMAQLEQQVKALKMEKEKESIRTQRELEESNRRLKRQLEEKERDRKDREQRIEEDYKRKMNDENLRKIERDNVENEKETLTCEFGVENEIRIVLIGKTGSDKSATGNTILGFNNFESLVSGSSVTSKCNRGETVRGGQKIVVVDTPGLFDTGMTNKKVTKEIVKCIGMTSPGPHAMVLVVGIGRFTKEEQETVQHFVDHFGEGMLKYMIVLFTRKDDLLKANQSVHQYVATVPPQLKQILYQCGNRYIAFNNDAVGSEKEVQVTDFFKMVDRMLTNNGGSCYTNEIYKEAEVTLQRRMRQQKQKFEMEKRWEKEQIELQIHRRYEKQLEKETIENSRLEHELTMQKSKEEEAKKREASNKSEIHRLQQQTIRQRRDTIDTDFFKMVDQMFTNNGGSCYTSEIYKEAEVTLQRRMRQQKQKLEMEKRWEKEQIELQIHRMYEKQLEKETIEKSRLEHELTMRKSEEGEAKKRETSYKSEIHRLQQELSEQRDTKDKARMERQMEQLKAVKMGNDENELIRLQRELESNRRFERQLKEKERDRKDREKRMEENYNRKPNDKNLRENERGNVENEKREDLDDILESLKRMNPDLFNWISYE